MFSLNCHQRSVLRCGSLALGSGTWLTPDPGRIGYMSGIHNRAQGTLCPFTLSLSFSSLHFHFSRSQSFLFIFFVCFFSWTTVSHLREREREIMCSNVRKSRVSQPGNYIVCRTTVTHTHTDTHKHTHTHTCISMHTQTQEKADAGQKNM